MGRYLAARGPDEETVLERDAFRVVFRRLAINDIAGGRQPFVTADGRLVAVVNGEIYNHRELARRYLSGVTLASRSDCEVVLHLFQRMGARFLEELNGIYSIAIWDDAARALLLARDRLGVKPLYYCALGGTLVFASELKALLVHPDAPRALDWGALHEVPSAAFPFERPAGREVATGIEGVSFVAPASYVEWHDGRLAPPVRYWSPPGPEGDPGDPGAAADYVDRYASLVDDAVRTQMMSDVPVGLFLSGGLDSSLIGAIASRVAPGIEAFTLAEPSILGTGDTEAAMDLARELEIRLHVVRVDQDALRSTLKLDLRALEYFVWSMDFPLFDVELLFKHELHRAARSARPDMKVILLGQGADEFAGGYSRLVGERWGDFTASEARSFHASLLRQMGVPPVYSRYVSRSVSEPLARARAGPHEIWQVVRFGDLAAYNLWHEDRMASANGMEVRVPFLDHRLVELLCSVPRSLREELFYDKAIERRAALRFLPAKLAGRPKVPLFPSGSSGGGSVSALRRSFVVGAFDEYREEYLEPARSLFSREELCALRAEAVVPGVGDAAVHLLCRCMAISIFERMCRELHRPEYEPPRLTTTSPPLTATGLPERGPVELTPTSRIALAGSVRLALSCEAAPALLVIEGGTLAARIALPPEWDWSGAPRGVFSASHVDIAGLARAFGVDVEAMRPLAAAFEGRGWGALTGGATPGDEQGGRADEG
ncbi:hypothetical protein BE08_05020 [Sorangium cellulosum]|uniref:asparagine synthase (glutamine-hydrolyzing) n=1 Tax=Sorangium cellulosum TaxID=56 RepID=A0A150PJK4_SORCE|nr:hypothetical protein BE08_05020 [Sorangium cellulosum]